MLGIPIFTLMFWRAGYQESRLGYVLSWLSSSWSPARESGVFQPPPSSLMDAARSLGSRTVTSSAAILSCFLRWNHWSFCCLQLQRYHLIPGSSAPAYPHIKNVRYFSAGMIIKRRVKDVTRESENLVYYSNKRDGQSISSVGIYPLNDALIRHSSPSANQLDKEHTKTVDIALYGKVQVPGFPHSDHATGSSIKLK